MTESIYFIFPCGLSCSLLPEPVEIMCRKKEKRCNCNLQAHHVDKLSSNLSRCGRKHRRTDGLMQCGRGLKPGRSEQRCQVTVLNTHSGEDQCQTDLIVKILFGFFFYLPPNCGKMLREHCCHAVVWHAVHARPQVCRRFHRPVEESGPFRKAKTNTHTHTHLWSAHVSHPVFWACVIREPWQPSTEGRKICAPPGRAPSLWQSCLNSAIP